MALAGPWLGGLTLVLLVTPRGPLGAGFRELELELEAGGSGSHSECEWGTCGCWACFTDHDSPLTILRVLDPKTTMVGPHLPCGDL